MKHLELHFERGVETVTLNRPEVRNAFNDEVIAELTAVLLELGKRDGIEARGGSWSAGEEAAFKQPLLEQFSHQSHPYYATARLWDDGLLDPAATRDALAAGLSAAANAPVGPARFGIFRM